MALNDKRTSVYDPENRADLPVYPRDVFTLTEAGTAQIQSGDATSLPREALALLVLLDGKEDVGHLEGRFPQQPPLDVRNTLRSLLAAGLIRSVTLAESGELDIDFAAFFGASAPGAAPSPAAQASAAREADDAHPKLERQGYYVSIARQALKPRPVAGAPVKALVVEDDPVVSMMVSRALTSAGFVVDVAADRAQVLEKIKQPPRPDIFVLDVYLPDLNGFDLLQRLKDHPVLKSVPAIMLTSEAGRDSIVRGLTTGADGYITKPFDPRQLVSGVKAILGIA